MSLQNLQKPSREFVTSYIEKFNSDERYYPADVAINNLINQYPQNNIFEDVLLKVTVINSLYSTFIRDVTGMSRHIVKLGIDSRLAKDDLSLVEDIATKHGIGRGKNGSRFFSFATKYCNWHRQNAYPIYDSYVEKILIAFRDTYHFSVFKNSELKDYYCLKRVIDEFIEKYSLTEFNMKAIDKFLWRYGKEIFPPKNKQA